MVAFAFTATPGHPANPQRCSAVAASESHAFIEAVWDKSHWQRDHPSPKAMRAWTKRLACAASTAHKHAMRNHWRGFRKRFHEYRERRQITPFFYYGHWWAVPYPIAICESGGNYFVGPSGAYGLIPPFPQYMSPAEQDRVAHQLYLEMGEAPWAPFESGCYLR
jgi:hypothetical protein